MLETQNKKQPHREVRLFCFILCFREIIISSRSLVAFLQEGGAEGVDVVKAFPGEEVDGEGAVAVVGVVEGLGDGLWLASDVAVGCCLAVDGFAKAQALLYGVGAHVEYEIGRASCRERV